jgi:hypothetical protein
MSTALFVTTLVTVGDSSALNGHKHALLILKKKQKKKKLHSFLFKR